MPPKRLIVIIAVILTLSITVSLMQAQQLMPLPQPGAPRAITELLIGGGFETDTDSDKLPDGWTANNTAAPASDKQKCNKPDKIVAHTGECAFQFKGNVDASKSNISQTIADTSAIVNGETLTFSAYIDPRSAAPGTTIGRARLKFSDGSRLKQVLAIPNNENRAPADYVLLETSATLVIPSGASITKGTVKFEYNLTSGKYLVDDASFAIGTADPTPPPSATVTETVSGTTPTPTITVTATPSRTPSPTATPLPLPTKLLAADGAADDNFGFGVAYSRNADTVLISTYGDDNYQGSAYIFVRSGDAWVQQAKLIASDGAANDRFGFSVALSANGNTALIGARFDDVGSNVAQGSAYVFTRSGTSWTQQRKLTASDGAADDKFGIFVALSADGDTALVGADGDTVGFNVAQGSAYVFTRSGTTWTEQAKLIASDGAAFDIFGDSLALSADGDTALVGANGDDVGSNVVQGSAYVFTRSGTSWTQQQQLTASNGAADARFGGSVALSADGDTALLGAYRDDIGANENQGSAYVFTHSGTSWAQQQQLIASDGAPNDFFGVSVALSGDGDTALMGVFYDDIGANIKQGSAYIFALP